MPRLKHIDRNYKKNPNKLCITSLWNPCPICMPKAMKRLSEEFNKVNWEELLKLDKEIFNSKQLSQDDINFLNKMSRRYPKRSNKPQDE